MSEIAKTTTFAVLAVAALLGAYLVNRGAAVVDVKQLVGQYLNEDIDVSAPKRLRVVKFDRETAAVREFEVAEVDGTWSIPSKKDYPADATRQMAEAATCVIDRKILRVAAEGAQSHANLGVIDPLSSKLDSKSEGVGTRVIMSDGDDKELVDMIIGKAVKDAPGQRYVRRSNQDVVYIVELDPANLSTDFNDWIEKDLLKINPLDVTKVFVNDYSADLGFVLTPQGVRSRVNWDRRNEMTLTYDNADSKWKLAEVKKFDAPSKEMVEEKITDDEEPDQDALGKLRTALDELSIVDVVRKPDGLSTDLKAGKDFLENKDAFEDLISKGFSPVAVTGPEPEILSSEGEVVTTLRDGVEYVLRFGQLQVQTESAEGDESAAEPVDAAAAAKAADGKTEAKPADPAKPAVDPAKPADEQDEKKAGENLRRYLFVMARFNEDAIEKPKLMELPPLPAGADKEAADKPADDEKKEDAAKADEQPADEKPTEVDAAIAERTAIEADNQRLMDEYQATVDAGKKKVADLNERFGDWYYVISNDVYKQIHLGRGQVIKKKDAKPAAGAGGADDALSGLPDLSGAAPAADAPAAEPPATQEPAAETPPADAAPTAEPPATEAAPTEESAPQP